MIDESRKAMIEYAINEYTKNHAYSLFCIDGKEPDKDANQVSRYELVDGKYLAHAHGKTKTLLPVSSVSKIIFPES